MPGWGFRENGQTVLAEFFANVVFTVAVIVRIVCFYHRCQAEML